MGKSDLIWHLIGNNNSFFVKNRINNGFMLTKDPFCINAQHSFANSGLIQDTGIAVSAGNNGGLNITTKQTKIWKNKGKNGTKHHNFRSFTIKGQNAAKKFAKNQQVLKRITAIHVSNSRAGNIARLNKTEEQILK